ncbi:MAG TPA: hypothetical protein VIU14_01970 [Mesorhizobium sp.]
MKTAIIALATILSLTGATFAKDAGKPTPSVETIDTGTTGSIQKSRNLLPAATADHPIVRNAANKPFASRLGIDVNPNFLPTYK